MTKVSDSMESARSVANGTLALRVLFDTDEEVAEALEWMKGKQKVKNLIVLSKKVEAASRTRRYVKNTGASIPE